MNNYCVDVIAKAGFYKNLASELGFKDFVYVAYVLNKYYDEKMESNDKNFILSEKPFIDMTDEERSIYNKFAEYIDNNEKNKKDLYQARGLKYLANYFALTINRTFNGETDDVVLDIVSALIEKVDKYVKSNNTGLTTEDVLKRYLSNFFGFVFDDFNEMRCNISRKILSITEDIKKYGDIKREADINGEEFRNYLAKKEELELNEKRIELLNKMLITDNWGVLCNIAKKKIAELYDIKIDSENKVDLVDNNEFYESFFEDNGYSEEEKPKDGWMTQGELISQYKTASRTVKKYLSFIPQQGKFTLLGTQKYYKPKYLYDLLLDQCHGCESSDDMMDAFEKISLKQTSAGTMKDDDIEFFSTAFKNIIFEDLKTNQRLKTDFFVSLAKVNKDFSSLYLEKDASGNVKAIYSAIHNKVYESNIYDKIQSRYNRLGKKGYLKDTQIQYVENLVMQITGMKRISGNFIVNSGDTKKYITVKNEKFNKIPYAVKVKLINDLFEELGISYSDKYYFDKSNDKKYIERGTADYVKKAVHDCVFNPKRNDLNKLINYIRNFISIQNSTTKKDFFKKYEEDDFTQDSEYAGFAITSDNLITNKLEDTFEKICAILEKYSPQNKYARAADIKNERGKTVTVQCDQQKSFMTQIEQRINKIINATSFEKVVDESGRTDVFDNPIMMYKDLPAEEKKKMMLEFFQDNYLDSCFFVTKDENGNVRILNKWIDNLINDITRKNIENTFAYNFQMRININVNDKHVKNTGFRDEIFKLMANFRSDAHENKDFWWCPVFILGDSESDQSIAAPRYDDNEILDGLCDVYKQEKQRKKIIEELNKQGKPIPNSFKKNKDKFVFLKFLNGKNIDDNQIVSAIQDRLIEKAFDFMLQIEKNNLTEEYSFIFKDADLLRADKENDNDYKERFRKTILDSFNDESSYKYKFYNFIGNYALASICQQQLFNIDDAFFSSTKDLQKRNKANYANGDTIDISARDEKGNLLWANKDNTDTINPIQKAIYFKEIKLNALDTNPEFMKSIIVQFSNNKQDAIRFVENATREQLMDKNTIVSLIGSENYNNVYKKYLENDVTDGQGYRHIDSYRKVAMSLHKWSKEQKEAYEFIKELESKGINCVEQLTPEQFNQLNEYAAVFQPFKLHGRYNEKIHINDELGCYFNPCEHKYAEVVLIPQLLSKNSLLNHVSQYMGKNGIDLVCSDACVKFGSYGEAEFQKDGENLITDSNSLNNIMSIASVHELDVRGLKMQSNVPLHDNVDNLFGTQARKLILNGINKKKIYNSFLKKVGLENGVKLTKDGEQITKLSGDKLFSFYNSLIAANQLQSFEKFRDKLYSRNEDGTLFIDKEKISGLLIENGLNNSRTKYEQLFSFLTVNNDIVNNIVGKIINESFEDNDFLIPFNEGSIEYEAFSLLASVYKNLVNKQKILGGSLVQASAFGFNGVDYSGNLKARTTGNNVIEVECEVPFNFTVTRHNGKRVKLDYNTYCNADGTFKDGKNSGKTLIEEDYPGILNMIAYRIPTEREYSMLNLKVVRCSNITSGGIIKVPQQFTTVAGFDFDIDKLYIIRRELKLVKPEWEKVFDTKEEWFKIKPQIMAEVRRMFPQENFIKIINIEKLIESYDYEDENGDNVKNLIWKEIYTQNKDIFEELKRIRPRNSSWSYASYFDSSDYVVRKAKSYGMTAKEYKNYLFVNAVNKLGYETITETNANEYEDFDEDLIISKGLTVGSLVRQAAKNIGIELYKNKNENKFEEYDGTKTVTENSRVSRNNMIFEIMRDRLEDEDTFKSRYYPGGFAELKDIAKYKRYLDKNPNVSYAKFKEENPKEILEDEEVFDPLTYVKYKIQNAIASKLIGMFANHNTNHSLCSLIDKLELSEKNAIRFGKQVNGVGNQSFIHKDANGNNDEAINRRVAELLAASVDAVKDPVFSYLNINLTTANIVAALVRLGYDFEDIMLLLNQPIIKRICNIVQNEDEYLDVAIQRIGKGMRKAGKTLLSTDSLRGALDESNENAKLDSDFQINVFNLFKDICAVSKELNQFVKSSKYTASNAVGTNIGEFLEQQSVENNNKYEKLEISIFHDKNKAIDVNKPIFDIDTENMSHQDYIDYNINNPFMFEQCAYYCNKKFLSSVNSVFGFGNNTYKSVTDEIETLSKHLGRNVNADTYNFILSSIPDYLLSKTDGKFNPKSRITYLSEGNSGFQDDNKEKETNANEYFLNVFPNDVMKFLGEHEEYRNKYEILSSIVKTTYSDYGSNNKMTLLKIDYKSYRDEKYSSSVLTQSWDAMTHDENKQIRDLANFLFYYSFFINGTSLNVFSFINLSPVSLKLKVPVDDNNNYATFIRKIRDGKIDINTNNFMVDFFNNNLGNPLFTRIVFENESKNLFKSESGVYKNNVTLDFKKPENGIGYYCVQNPQSSIFSIISNLYEDKDNEESKENGYYVYPIIKVGNYFYKVITDGSPYKTYLGKKKSEGFRVEFEKITSVSDFNSYSGEPNSMKFSAFNAHKESPIVSDKDNRNIQGAIDELQKIYYDNGITFPEYTSFEDLIEKTYKNPTLKGAPVLRALSIAYQTISDDIITEENFHEQLQRFFPNDYGKFDSDYINNIIDEAKVSENYGDVVSFFNGLVKYYTHNNDKLTIIVDGVEEKLC